MFATGTNRRERYLKAYGRNMGRDMGDKLPWSVAERFRVYLYEKTHFAKHADFSTVVV